MNSKVIEIKNSLLRSSSYLIGNYLVDCGDGKKIVDAIEENGVKLKGILLTHSHQDHIYGLPFIMEKYPCVKIFCSKAILEGLKNNELNLQYIMPEYSFEFHYEDSVVLLEEGNHHLDENMKVEVILTKGHSFDSQSYIIEGNIFTGDAHIPFAKVFTKWPSSDKAAAKESELKILKLTDERNLTIKPGHWQK